MIETTVGWTTTKLRPENKFLTTIVSTAEYAATRPNNLIEPGVYSTKARQKAKAKKCYDDKVLTCWYADKQFWVGFKAYKPNNFEKAMWEKFHDDYWHVPEIDDEHPSADFLEHADAKAYLDSCKNTYGIKPQHRVCKDPAEIRWIFKMPWITLCLENYDIAQEWNTWLFDTYKLDYMCELVKMLECARVWIKEHDT